MWRPVRVSEVVGDINNKEIIEYFLYGMSHMNKEI